MFSSVVSRVAVVAGLIAAVAAQNKSFEGLSVLAPGGPNLWWVDQAENTLVWSCETSKITNFTVLVANAQLLAAAPEAIVAIQPNYDCSLTITASEVQFAAGSGYTIQLANPLNATDVWAESAEFQIMSFGSAYPNPSNTPTQPAGTNSVGSGATVSSTGTNTGSAATTSTTNKPNGALSTRSSMSGLAVAFIGAGVAALLA